LVGTYPGLCLPALGAPPCGNTGWQQPINCNRPASRTMRRFLKKSRAWAVNGSGAHGRPLRFCAATALWGMAAGSGAQHIFSELATAARRCALAELRAGLACRPACSRLQRLRNAGIPPLRCDRRQSGVATGRKRGKPKGTQWHSKTSTRITAQPNIWLGQLHIKLHAACSHSPPHRRERGCC
jgi:hypothetical protein